MTASVPPPDLERAMPGDADPDGEVRDVPAGTVAPVLFGDGTWRTVDLREWQRDRRGRWRCQLEWFDGSTTRSGWFVYDAGKMKAAPLKRSIRTSKTLVVTLTFVQLYPQCGARLIEHAIESRQTG